MIKGVFTHGRDGRRGLLIGISRENWRHLLNGEPIAFDGAEFGIDAPVIVVGGETEDDIVLMLRKEGLLPPKDGE